MVLTQWKLFYIVEIIFQQNVEFIKLPKNVWVTQDIAIDI